MVKVLVVDAGGRGNAIAHAFARSKHVKEVFVAPGNAGSEFFEKCRQAKLEGKYISSIRALDEIVRFAKLEEVDLVFVGPEEPLSLGLVDLLEEEGIPAVGPRKEATIIEASKCWTKDFLDRIGVPIPGYRNFDDPEDAREYVKEYYAEGRGNLVVKADGLAAGKGVYVCNSADEALQAIDDIMVKRKFGDAGNRIEIEERLYGIEVAFTAISDGKTVRAFGHAKDYKRAFDSDDIEGMREFYIGVTKKFISKSEAERLYKEGRLLNPNTGGMGAVSPHPAITPELEEKIMDMVVKPVIENFRKLEGKTFKGILYPVIMLVEKNGELIPKVLEINVRECDPGAQAKLPRLETDMYELSMAVVEGKLDEVDVKFSNDCCVGVCAVSGALKGREGFKPGYPADHYTSQPMEGLEEAMKEAILYANGIAKPDGYQTTGGRVITVVGRGKTVDEARERAYSAIQKIKFPGMRYRKTIGLDVPD
ncbi:phosphoribosylamine--glycine ligase [Archaeoglobus veneficus]|uniref:Phosphoribosylamine--glycine ligase n=1 Tax=Archaeoglobus veneficus (strain DSM 11195 / SNP6) TaxID=693661 RepID=F2KND7_ARCVS|nr:phosphoribosylamine--glycine ligase [Archaeoglobus veneficus]AEA47339.1 phosphoribosylamine/glycine ligase [Archaeoglobus veneficus SNP6]